MTVTTTPVKLLQLYAAAEKSALNEACEASGMDYHDKLALVDRATDAHNGAKAMYESCTESAHQQLDKFAAAHAEALRFYNTTIARRDAERTSSAQRDVDAAHARLERAEAALDAALRMRVACVQTLGGSI